MILDEIIAIDRPTFPLNEENPCRWDHGVMGDVLVQKVLGQGLDGVDRKKLIPALSSLLETPEAGARTRVAQGIGNLTIEETLEVAGSVVKCMKQGAPVNAAMDGAASVSQGLLAKHSFEEALPLSLRYGAGKAAKNKIPEKYGRAALTMPSSRELMKSIGEQMLIQAVDVREVIDQIQTGAGPEKLNQLKVIRSLKAAESTLTLPATQTELVVDATNYGVSDENDTTYTWRKVYGAGQVAFAPNASGQSKSTTVSFTDQKPGKYRFEVTMTDTLGYNQISKTLDITLYDKRGKLPGNKPPQATSQSLKAVPGLPLQVTLAGTDPDGDDLGFAITKQPAHGRLSGIGGDLVYIANYRKAQAQPTTKKTEAAAIPKGPSLDDFDALGDLDLPAPKKAVPSKRAALDSWTDSFTFEAVDGQGKTATGTIDFVVSDKDVGLVVYEGFNYPTGTVIGQGGGTSFGFSGPWKKNDGRSGGRDFWVEAGSLDDLAKARSFSYARLPSTGGKLIKGAGHRHCLRALDREALAAHKLLDNGGELWFSLFVQGPGGKGQLRFGLGGNGVDLGFLIKGYSIHASLMGEEAGTSRNPWSRAAGLRFSEKEPNMIIGRCVWGKTDRDPDTLEIYRVFDAPEFGPLVLDEPACVLNELIAQENIRSISLHAQVPVDEIRIGPTLHSVMLGTKPLVGK
jgi:hypothetical protein